MHFTTKDTKVGTKATMNTISLCALCCIYFVSLWLNVLLLPFQVQSKSKGAAVKRLYGAAVDKAGGLV